jgi:flavin reductase (DIM6/NTAB) family NADH-FMN oxidoreductase RutF
MKKQKLGPTLFTFPMPVVLVGTIVNDKVNFMTAAWCGIACLKPETISVAINTTRHTLVGIKENKTFSINVPSVEQVKKVDYCGIYSGKKVDKSKDFEIFYGELATAPLIEECSLNLECEVINIINIGTHDLIIGTIAQSHAAETIIEKGIINPEKINPLIYNPGLSGEYHALGTQVAKAFSIGKK